MAEISSPGNVECALACLRNETCLSFNFAIVPHPISKLYTCQLLPIDKYWNPDRFALSQQFHHYAIPVGLVSKWPLVVVHFSLWRTKCPKRNKILFDGQIYQVTGKFSVLTKLTFGIPQGQIHGPRSCLHCISMICLIALRILLFGYFTTILTYLLLTKQSKKVRSIFIMTQEWEEMARCHWILIRSILSLNVVKIGFVVDWLRQKLGNYKRTKGCEVKVWFGLKEWVPLVVNKPSLHNSFKIAVLGLEPTGRMNLGNQSQPYAPLVGA